MSEAELVALEDRVRQEGRTGSSSGTSRSPLAPANTSISYTASSMSLSRSLIFVPIPHVFPPYDPYILMEQMSIVMRLELRSFQSSHGAA